MAYGIWYILYWFYMVDIVIIYKFYQRLGLSATSLAIYPGQKSDKNHYFNILGDAVKI